MKFSYLHFITATVLIFLIIDNVSGFGSDKMRLEDVKVLTLKAGRMTTGRRSSPVPQMKCISNCNTLLPDSIQCINRGWDGQSIQWECKGDFQEGYRFGDLDVICEGYDYADDPYILTGSCGLEYTVRGSGNAGQQQSYGWQQDVLHKKSNNSSDFGTWIFLIVVGIVVYALYVTCIAGNNVDPTSARSTTNNDYPPDDRQAPNMGWNVPGTGNQYGGGGLGGGGASCGAGAGQQAGAGGGGGGFWTGLATGGFMGYMFGNRGGNQHRGQYYRQTPSTGSSFFSQPSYGSSSYGSSSSSSTSTGFAGTRRR